MLKKIISFAFLLSLVFAASSQANWGWQSQGYYNPAFFNQGPGFGAGFNPYWGGGYNLNSMMGNGGWGGFPAGYGTMMMPPSIMQPSMPAAGVCPSGGAMTGGFGGYYSPFIGGY